MEAKQPRVYSRSDDMSGVVVVLVVGRRGRKEHLTPEREEVRRSEANYYYFFLSLSYLQKPGREASGGAPALLAAV